MSGFQKTSVLLFALLCGVVFCSPLRADQPKHKSHKAVAKQAEPAPQAAPAPPPPPPTPEQMPAVPAQVTYQNSQLTILARNSTLGDILRAVHKQTGANVDAPPNATQRVVGQFGPGPARDVLASVLDASDFNYVILGSQANPSALAQVIITAKSSAPASNNVAAQPQPQPPDETQTQDTSAEDNSDQPPPSESFVPQDNQPADNQSSDDQNSQDQNGNPQKTPEQLLQELQRQQMIQQQQLQQQQQQNQGGDSSQQPDQMHQMQR